MLIFHILKFTSCMNFLNTRYLLHYQLLSIFLTQLFETLFGFIFQQMLKRKNRMHDRFNSEVNLVLCSHDWFKSDFKTPHCDGLKLEA